MDHARLNNSAANGQGGPLSLGGEADIDAAAADALAALLARKLQGLQPGCPNDELVDAAMIEAMAIVPGTAWQVRARLMSVARHRADARPSRRRRPKGRRR